MFKKYMAFVGLTSIAFIAFLEYMAVNNALPNIQDAFHVSILQLQWINNIYSITLGATLILFGKFGDLFGYKRMFLIGAFLLILGSFGAGFISHFELLLFFRGIQSLGIAIIVVIAPGIIQMVFEGKTRVLMSIYATITGIGLLVGPYLGGVIVMHLGWQWVFYINIPLLIVALIPCIIYVPEHRVHLDNLKIDYLGNILLVISLVSLIYALIRQQEVGFDSVTIINLLVFIISTPILIYVELNQNAPILNFKFFSNKDFTFAVLSNLMAGVLMSCGMFFSPIFLQKVYQLTPKATGAVLLVFALGTVTFAPIMGRLLKKLHEQKSILIGLISGVVAAVAYILFFAFDNLFFGIIAFYCSGMVLAVNNVVSAISAIKGVGEKNAGVAIGTIFGMFNIIAAISLAIASVIFHFINEYAHNPKIAYTSVFIVVSLYAISLLFVANRIFKAVKN